GIEAGALRTEINANGIPVLRFRPGSTAVLSAEYKRVNEILRAGEDIVQVDLRALEELAQNDRKALKLLKYINDTQCGNISAAVDEYLATGQSRPVLNISATMDEYLATGRIRPDLLSRGRPTIANIDQMIAARGEGWGFDPVWNPKSSA